MIFYLVRSVTNACGTGRHPTCCTVKFSNGTGNALFILLNNLGQCCTSKPQLRHTGWAVPRHGSHVHVYVYSCCAVTVRTGRCSTLTSFMWYIVLHRTVAVVMLVPGAGVAVAVTVLMGQTCHGAARMLIMRYHTLL